MSFNHSIVVTEIKKQNQLDSFSDVIVHCRWDYKTYHVDHPDIVLSTPGATPFTVEKEDLSDNFINYEDLNEETVITWIESNAVGVIQDIKRRHIEELTEQIQPTFEVVYNPWDNPDLPSTHIVMPEPDVVPTPGQEPTPTDAPA